MNICICGNLLYFEEMTQIAVGETLRGNFVLMPINKISKKKLDIYKYGKGSGTAITKQHFKRIDLSDEVWIVHENHNWGAHTTNEIRHADNAGIKIKYITLKEYLKTWN